MSDRHDCLNLRFPGAKEFQWNLLTPEGPRRFEITGPFESDDGDVLTGWALDGRGIVMKPIFEIAGHLRIGALAADRGLTLIAVGDGAEGIAEGAKGAPHFPVLEDAAKWLARAVKPGDVVLFKGSRSATVEKVMSTAFPRN